MSHGSLALPLTTARLSLRLHRSKDAQWLHSVYSQPEVSRYLLQEPWTIQQTEDRLKTRMERTGLDGEAKALALIIERDAVPVGDVQIWLTDAERGVAEIGWVLDPTFSGHGYAREAVRAILAVAFDHYRLHRVVAQMDARNAASARLATGVGMQREAHFRQDWWNKGEWTDTLVHAILASDR